MDPANTSLTERSVPLPRLAVATSAEQEVWLDRLADGELTDEQRRAVLLQLEELPGGWRNCALAFVQSQVVSQDLHDVLRQISLRGEDFRDGACDAPKVVVVAGTCDARGYKHNPARVSNPARVNGKLGVEQQSCSSLDNLSALSLAEPKRLDDVPAGLSTHKAAPQPHKSPRRKSYRRLAGHLGIVACFAVAFCLGVVLRHVWDGGGTQRDSLAGGSNMMGPDLRPLVLNGSNPPGVRVGGPGIVGSGGVGPGGVGPGGVGPGGVGQGGHSRSMSPAGSIKMVVDQGEGRKPAELQVPVVAGASLAAWLKEQPPVISPRVAEALRNQGHRVDVWAEYLPIILDDGRTVLVPLELVEVELRDKKEYQ